MNFRFPKKPSRKLTVQPNYNRKDGRGKAVWTNRCTWVGRGAIMQKIWQNVHAYGDHHWPGTNKSWQQAAKRWRARYPRFRWQTGHWME